LQTKQQRERKWEQVRVESAARLHMGFIDLHGGLGRRFGSIGVALEHPKLILEATLAENLRSEGPDGERAEEFARRFYAHYQPSLPSPAIRAHIRVIEAIPLHQGLGSGTQLALAVGTALARLHGIEADPFELAQVMERGRRSSIGIGAFQQGGFLLDGGRRLAGTQPAPILVRRDLPSDWLFVIVQPPATPGLSGTQEDRAFVNLPLPPEEAVGRLARLVMMQMLPALVEEDIVTFGAALTEVQRLVGDSFTPVQGGRFANPLSAQLISDLLEYGALGAGQSSWGPTVYGLVKGEKAAQALAEQIRVSSALSSSSFSSLEPATVYCVPASNHGARITETERKV